MGNVLFLIAFMALPIVTYVRVRSVSWLAIYMTGAFAAAGMLVNFLIDLGHSWTYIELQGVLLLAFSCVAVLAFLSRVTPAIPMRNQVLAIFVPTLLLAVFFLISRLAAAPDSGLFTGVGYFITNVDAEDNAKWLDFTSQLSSGLPISQAVPMGGPLQLVIVFVATVMTVVSMIALGGANQVMVSVNSIIYTQALLVIAIPVALAPLAEMKLGRKSSAPGRAKRKVMPAAAYWVGVLVLTTGSMAGIGYGHLTMQFVFLVIGLWAATFLARSGLSRAGIITSLSAVIAASVWFPLAPLAAVILLIYAAWFVVRLARVGGIRGIDPISVALWLIVLVGVMQPTFSALLFMADVPNAASVPSQGGGIHAGIPVPRLDLLTSGGGTEIVAAALGFLAAASVILAAIFIARLRRGFSAIQVLIAFWPSLLLVVYALGLSLFGTWWSGAGPNYGANKTMFLTTIVLLAVSIPLAVIEVAGGKARLGVAGVAAVAVVVYVLTVDSLLPRALANVSPNRFPSAIGEVKSYWGPAEVRHAPDQSIALTPIGCIRFPQGAPVPTGMPNGQTTYSCTRILVGLSGMDRSAQPIVDLLRREWLTDSSAWTAAWPDLVKMEPEVLDKQLILLDDYDNVVGLETVRSLLDRFRPEWAVGQPLLAAQP